MPRYRRREGGKCECRCIRLHIVKVEYKVKDEAAGVEKDCSRNEVSGKSIQISLIRCRERYEDGEGSKVQLAKRTQRANALRVSLGGNIEHDS